MASDPPASSASASTASQSPQPFDIASTKALIQDLQQRLQTCYNNGDAQQAASLAQQLTSATQTMRSLEQSHQQAKHAAQQSQYQSAQIIDSLQSIKETVFAIQTTILQLKQRMLQYMQCPSPATFPFQPVAGQQSNQSTAAAADAAKSAANSKLSFVDRMAASLSSNSGAKPAAETLHQHRMDYANELMNRCRKSIQEAQILFEQQLLKLDSIDLSSNQSNSVLASDLLQSFKAMRKDHVTQVQSHLAHVDEFEAHIQAYEQFISFLQQRPPSASASSSASGNAQNTNTRQSNRTRASRSPMPAPQR